LAYGPTYIRKSIDSLAAIVQEQFALNPFSSAWFVSATDGVIKIAMVTHFACGCPNTADAVKETGSFAPIHHEMGAIRHLVIVMSSFHKQRKEQHWHSFYEFGFCVEGNGRFYVGHEALLIGPGMHWRL
jgi:hypothetical protein